MNGVVYLIAGLGSAAGIVSVLAVVLSRTRLNHEREDAWIYAADALDTLARDVGLRPEDAQVTAGFLWVPGGTDIRVEREMPPNRIAEVRRRFFDGSYGERARPGATRGGIGLITLDAYASDAAVQKTVLSGLLILRGLEQQGRHEPERERR